MAGVKGKPRQNTDVACLSHIGATFMVEEFLINFTPQETRVALLQQGSVQEIHIERSSSKGSVGNIYLGKVVRVLPGMQSAFIDIGGERTAFLHVADLYAPRHSPQAEKPIESRLAEGENIVVQVLKDPIGTKGARLSTQISIAGRMLVYLPQDNHIGISQRIEGEENRELLRSRVTELVDDDIQGGFIVRTIAAGASDDELLADINYLRKLWNEIISRKQGGQAPAPLYQDLNLGQRVLRDFVSPDTTRILIDSRENFQKLSHFAREYIPGVLPLLEYYVGDRPLFDVQNIEEEIEKALARRVDLKSGGYLIIDQTEALTTVDVNTGAFVGARNFDETIFKTNLEATQTIARQLRLRNLGGIIIIDFIDMKNNAHRETVLEALNKALSKEHTKMSITGFTQLGLVEMTRKRTRESLAHLLCEPCPTCSSRGEIKTARTICYEVLRELVREAKQFNPKEFRVLASTTVVNLFHDEESQHLASVVDFIQRPIAMIAESSYLQEQYDIVLL